MSDGNIIRRYVYETTFLSGNLNHGQACIIPIASETRYVSVTCIWTNPYIQCTNLHWPATCICQLIQFLLPS